MKKIAIFMCSLVIIGMLTACTNNLTSKKKIIRVFEKNEKAIVEAIESNNVEQTKEIPGIQDVYVSDDYIEFSCGGSGFGSSTHYYGFFYSLDDNLTAWNGGMFHKVELVKSGNGYRWEEKDGDNIYYVEEIGEHFFYYEAHF